MSDNLMNALKKIFCLHNALLITLILTACNYHLRGQIDIPSDMRSVYLQGASVALHDQFVTSFNQSGIKLTQSPDEASFIISISDENLQRRALSLNAGGRANEFGLIYSLKYQISDAKNKPLVNTQALEIKREYYNDQQAILAKDNEEMVIRGEIYQSAVRSIINRAQIELKQKFHAP
jgi:LPS-assembly lipoprotein